MNKKEFQFLPFKNSILFIFYNIFQVGKEAKETVMILFLGGINHAELSSIKTIGINLGNYSVLYNLFRLTHFYSNNMR